MGDALLAVFGAPVAHEDDAERAVHAALAIRDGAMEGGVALRVAVNTGEAWSPSTPGRPRERGWSRATSSTRRPGSSRRLP